MKENRYEKSVKVMLVDDEKHFLESIRGHLLDRGYIPITAESGEAALKLFNDHRPDIVISDQKMPGMDGISLVQQLREIDPIVPILMITAYSNVRDAIDAIRAGAFDYITKPFMIDDLELHIQKALRMSGLEKENRSLKAERTRTGAVQILGKSAAISEMRDWIEKVGPTDATVLLLGETGAGKDLAARAIHETNTSRNGPFVIFDCGSFAPTLMESELFGHVKGAFTGADLAKQGCVEVAEGGTLFFDEIGELELSSQTRLLRLIDERTYSPVGSSHKRSADVRIIVATNRDLEAAVSDNRFRRDLFWRLNSLTFTVPALKERPDDIALLSKHFLGSFARKYRKPVKSLSPSAAGFLRAYNWPGNVRELKNVVESLVITFEGDTVTPEALPPRIRGCEGPLDDAYNGISYQAAKKQIIEEFDRKYLCGLLARCEGNVTKAAECAGIERSNFLRLLHQVGIAPDDFR